MFFPLWFSHDGPKSSKNVPKPSKIPSLLSAHAGIYICSLMLLFDKWVPLLHEATLFQEMCAPLARNIFSRNVCPSCTKPHFLRKMCAPLAPNPTFLQKHRNPHAWIREQLSKSAHLPDQTHARTKYPVRGNPSLRCSKC